MKGKSGSKGRGNMCLVVTCSVVIAIVLLVVILAFTVFKPRQPIITVDSIKLQDMDMDMNVFILKVNVNMTLKVDVSVKNTNKFGFEYSDGNAQLNYRGELIGEAPIPNGEILSEEIKGMSLTLTIIADRLLSNSQVVKDVSLGTLPLNTLVRVSGKVNILGLIKFHVGSTSSCDFTINISNKTIVENECKDETKL